MLNLRDRQLHALSNVLSLNGTGIESSEDFTDQWKVLVYDQDCRDIISPLMNVGALRSRGVTLHLMLHSDREAIPEAPAVYFVRPNNENIKRIIDDCSNQLYRSFHLHFVTRIDRPLMENMAHGLVTNNAAGLVSKVYDEYLDMISLEPNLYTLNVPHSFVAYNLPSLTESDIRLYISRLTSGLVSLVRVLGVLPIIRAPGGGPAEMVAQELCSALRENLSPRGAAHSIFGDFLVSDRPRPLLLVLDRTSDLATPLMHSSSYQSLVDDLLEYKLNRVSVSVPDRAGGPPRKKTYDLNTQVDPFFKRYAGSPFPEAVEANETELASVCKREAEIRSSRPSATGSGEGAGDLSEAITSLPEILSKKANLEAHTNILQAVMKQVAAREVPSFFELEQTMVQSGVDRAAVLELLSDPAKGTLEDKARLLAMVALLLPDKSAAAAEEYIAAFTRGCKHEKQEDEGRQEVDTNIERIIGAVSFLRRLQKIQSPIGTGGYVGTGGGDGGKRGAIISSFLNTATSSATTLMARASALFAKFSPLPVTRVVDNLAEGRSCPEDDTYCCLDPRQAKGASGEGRGRKFAEVIVFIVGGGCLVEHFNLQELVKQKGGGGGGGQVAGGSALTNVIYGGSELLSSASYLEQLQQLGVAADMNTGK
mmetsp:Transcript_8618/g.12859  ORF Transcript_8618/g.12859 Transcript_8618/m.12859 type:complete len:651 (-) Transcript_8618:37-1989(-)